MGSSRGGSWVAWAALGLVVVAVTYWGISSVSGTAAELIATPQSSVSEKGPPQGIGVLAEESTERTVLGGEPRGIDSGLEEAPEAPMRLLVSGRVVDQGGDPVGEVRVEVIDRQSGVAVAGTSSTDDGRYAIEGARTSGDGQGLLLRANKAGFKQWEECCFSIPAVVNITVRPEVSVLLQGRVSSVDDGLPVPGAIVRVTKVMSQAVVGEDTASKSGQFAIRLSGDGGAHTLRVAASGFQLREMHLLPERWSDRELEVGVQPNDALWLSGTVVDYDTYNPVVGAVVEDPYGNRTETGWDGSFRLSAARARGQYAGFIVLAQGYSPVAIGLSADKVGQPQVVELTPVSMVGIRIEVPEGYAAPDCWVVVSNAALAKERRRAEVRRVAAGEYVASIKDGNRRIPCHATATGAGLTTAFGECANWDGSEEALAELPLITMSEGRSISGQVLDGETGEPVAMMNVGVFLSDDLPKISLDGLREMTLRARTDSLGRFEVTGLPPNTPMSLCAYRKDYALVVATGVSGAEVTGLDATPLKEVRLVGHVRRQGAGVAGALVVLRNEVKEKTTVVTTSEGAFEVDVYEGAYKVHVARFDDDTGQWVRKNYRERHDAMSGPLEIELD